MRSLNLLAAAALAFAPAAYACDAHKASVEAKAAKAEAKAGQADRKTACAANTGGMHAAGHSGKDCCAAKAGAVTADAKGHAGHGDVVPASTTAGAAKASRGCPHSAKGAGDATLASANGAAGAASADGARASCPLAKLRDAAGHGCKTSAATLAAAREVKATGKVLCRSCDLHQGEACVSVFQAAGGKETYRLCGEGSSEQLLKLTKHGELDVTVHGRLSPDAQGEAVLCIEGFTVGTI